MSASIAKPIGIFKFGRLAYAGVLCSIASCYAKVAIISILILLGAAETIDINIHLQAIAMTEEQHQIHEAGFDGYQSKPIDITDFLNTVQQVLTQRRNIDNGMTDSGITDSGIINE